MSAGRVYFSEREDTLLFVHNETHMLLLLAYILDVRNASLEGAANVTSVRFGGIAHCRARSSIVVATRVTTEW